MEIPDITIDIYKIYHIESGKTYIGQTKSHVLNHGKYTRHGYLKRFKDHISEAINNTKEKQCTKLNNAIRFYGEGGLSVLLIDIGSIAEGDEFEEKYIAL